MRCGLLGRSLSHSYSPQIHRHLGSYTYDIFEKEPQDLDSFFCQGDFLGINVTIPYKKTAISYCQTLSPEAERLGAVNTIIRNSDGTYVGHNTDYFGFRSMAQRMNIDYRGKKVLVLGSGGASNTVVAVMEEMGANVVVISRCGENNYDNLHLHKDCTVVVNATPVGMYPNTEQSPVDLTAFPKLEGVMDLIYNPGTTKLLYQAQQLGIKTQNGLCMLVAQAKESAEWFTGVKIDDSCIATIASLLEQQMKNIVLIGMPGCGKSTVGQLLAEKLGRPFVDSDSKIEETTGRSIPDILQNDPETVFRQEETRVLKNLCKQSGLVIATGGGCVTVAENHFYLRQNSVVIWIQRPLEHLPTNGRPLSQNNSLKAMYEVRKPMYNACCDLIFQNDTTPSFLADEIIKTLSREDL